MGKRRGWAEAEDGGRRGKHRLREGEEISPSHTWKRGTRDEMVRKTVALLHCEEDGIGER